MTLKTCWINTHTEDEVIVTLFPFNAEFTQKQWTSV